MCAVSMIYDHFDEKWRKYSEQQPPPTWVIARDPKGPTKEEIDEFHKLLERARAYDKKMNQPDCELEEKREKLRKLAKELGVEIDFA